MKAEQSQLAQTASGRAICLGELLPVLFDTLPSDL
jgi:hypothetical protein